MKNLCIRSEVLLVMINKVWAERKEGRNIYTHVSDMIF